MGKKSILLTIATAAVVVPCMAQAAVSVSTGGFNYTQNFDTLAASGAGNAWGNDSTLSGWSLYRQPAPGAAITTYNADNGGNNAGVFYSYGGISATDRSLGGLGSGGAYFGSPASGNVAGWMALAMSNDSGAALSGFTLSFNGEQWRNGGNATAQNMLFEYGFGATFGSVASWTAPGGTFDWTTPVTGTTAAAVDGNVAGRVNGRGGSIVTAWHAGDTLWLRWTERNDTGNDHGLAIDDLSITADAPSQVPLPAAVWLLMGGLGTLFGAARRRAAQANQGGLQTVTAGASRD